MPVVSNASPILNLAIIGRLSMLRQQFRQIQIPTAVLEELRVEETLPGSEAIREAVEARWIQIQEARNRPVVQLLREDLDRGEAEAIALALQLEADWTLLDEREGRRIAQELGLNVTGILGILLNSWRAGELSSVREAIDELRDRAAFRIRADLLARVLQESGEAER